MDAAKPRSAHYFDRFVLDVARGVLLTTDGRQVPLRPKSFAMLKLFVENTGLLLDHDCIMQAVWPGLIIANEGIVQCVRDIRRALGDDSQRILKTVPRRGYVFVVEAAAHVRTGGDGSQSAPGEFDTMSDRPSVAVLPLNAATPDEAYVAAGLAEDLITALARLRSLTVIPGAFGFPGQVTQDPRHAGRVGRALSADYVLEGGVRQAGTHLRVTTRLVSSATEAVVWADRLEGEASELFALQDLITRVVTVAVETHVLGMEIERVMRKGSSGLGARDLYVRALPGYRAQTAESMAGSIALLRRAVALDPGCARALATLAHCLQQQITQGWRAHHADAATEALALARQALVADRSDPVVLAVAGFVSTWLAGDHELGAELSTKATVLGEHSALVLAMTGAVSVVGGESDEAICRLDAGMRLDPFSPYAARLYTNLAGANLFAGRFDEAARLALRAVSATPDFTVSRLYLIVALSLGGYRAAAEHAIAQMEARERAELPYWPGRMSIQLRHAWMPELLDEGLRRAGLAPDGSSSAAVVG